MRLILFLILTCLLKQGFAQDDVKIIWHKDSLLKWFDFQGPIDKASTFSAFAYYGETYHYNWRSVNNEYLLTFTTDAYFVPSKSWVKAGMESPNLLTHEQMHFDIAAFFARILLSDLNKHTYTAAYKTEVEQIYQDWKQKRQEMEELYDTQTDHSKNKLMQVRWELYVYNILKEPCSYEDAKSREPTLK